MDEADITHAKVQKDGALRDLIDVIDDPQTDALAGLTPTADSVPYFTSETTAAVTSLTSFGRSLIDDASATVARTTLGLAIGTDVQAYDSELAAIAGVTSAADKLPYFTGAGTAAVTDLKSFARGYLSAANLLAHRQAVGIKHSTWASLYRSPQTALVGPTANSWEWMGTGVTASLIQFRGDQTGQRLVYAYWRVVWDPNAGGFGSTGVRLVHADSGPSNITAFSGCSLTATDTGTVRNDAVNVLTELQGFLDGGTYKQIGHQGIGNATNAPKIYMSELELVWE
jgi:hypothetical protein